MITAILEDYDEINPVISVHEEGGYIAIFNGSHSYNTMQKSLKLEITEEEE